MGLMRRSLYKCSEKTKKPKLLILHFRPHVEFALVIWDPHTKAICKKIEKMHRNAARFVKKNNDRSLGTVTKLLAEIKWNSNTDAKLSISLYFIKFTTTWWICVGIPSDRYPTPVTQQGLCY